MEMGGGVQIYGPFLGPLCNMAFKISGISKGTMMLTSLTCCTCSTAQTGLDLVLAVMTLMGAAITTAVAASAKIMTTSNYNGQECGVQGCYGSFVVIPQAITMDRNVEYRGVMGVSLWFSILTK